jgi:5-methylcytosine-specific restriction endonuclease McrA
MPGKKPPSLHLRGKQFGRLTLKDWHPATKERRGKWECLCACGTIIFVQTNALTTKNTVSCGCFHQEVQCRPRLPPGIRKERERIGSQAYYRAHKSQQRARHAHYRKTHPDIMAAIRSRRDAVKRGSTRTNFTRAQWREIQAAYNYRCVYCGKKPRRLTKDHITPLSKGGEHTYRNIVPACLSCNSGKKDKKPPKPVQPLLLIVAS